MLWEMIFLCYVVSRSTLDMLLSLETLDLFLSGSMQTAVLGQNSILVDGQETQIAVTPPV